MTPIRFSIIRGRIAELLGTAANLFPEERLAFDLRMVMDPAPTKGEFDHVIRRMEQLGQILRHRTEDEGVKVKLTELGQAELLK